MGIGASIVLLAAGAIMTFALDVTMEGLDLDTVGVILMIAGGLGLLISLLFWSSVAPFGSRTADRTVIREERFELGAPRGAPAAAPSSPRTRPR